MDFHQIHLCLPAARRCQPTDSHPHTLPPLPGSGSHAPEPTCAGIPTLGQAVPLSTKHCACSQHKTTALSWCCLAPLFLFSTRLSKQKDFCTYCLQFVFCHFLWNHPSRLLFSTVHNISLVKVTRDVNYYKSNVKSLVGVGGIVVSIAAFQC